MNTLGILGTFMFLIRVSSSADDTVFTSAVAMLNEKGRIPCDVRSGIPGDRIVLILWYRGTAGTPIYSFDARGKRVEEGTRWTDEALLGTRAHFHLSHTDTWVTTAKFGAHLELEPTLDRDQAFYRCRVDFKISTTKNTIVNFTVILPPNRPEIYNSSGHVVSGGMKSVSIVGPYNEGDQLILICRVRGGRPSPNIFWVVKDEVWRTEIEEEVGGSLKTTLLIRRLTRHYLHSVFQCQATNFNASSPVTSSVTIDMNFRPANVTILSRTDPMSSYTDYELVCKTWGSRPPATITWLRDGTELLSRAVMTTSSDSNVTTSILRYHSDPIDSGKSLTCRAENKFIPHVYIESSMQLNIHFQPVVTLQMGSSLNPETIKEGDDVYFECHINANPAVNRVLWHHNGSPVDHQVTRGILIQNQTLVLQKVSRSSAGLYTCKAISPQGEGDSLPVRLKVMYKPYCRRQTKTIYGTALHESASVTCEVEALPSSVTFRWTFNNTSEHLPIPTTAVASQGMVSVASYAPKSHLDYGTLLCWAFNDIGEQMIPCAFAIIPAGPPDPPKNCTIINQTTDTIEVQCSAGFDGGLTQVFYMEVYDTTTGSLHLNFSSNEPYFLLTSLRPGIAFLMVTYAVNAKGRSESAKLETFTLKVAEKRTGPPVLFEFTPLSGVLIGVLVAIFLIVAIVILVTKCRNLQPSDGNELFKDTVKDDLERRPLNHGSLRQIVMERSNSTNMEEKDPDVIPHGADILSCSQYKTADRQIFEGPEDFSSTYQDAPPPQHNPSQDEAEVTYVELAVPKTDPSTYPKDFNGDRCIYSNIDHNRSTSALRQSSNNISTASTTTNSSSDVLSAYPSVQHRRSSSTSSGFGYPNYHTSNPNLYTSIDYRRGGGTATTSISASSSHYSTLPHRREGVYSPTSSISSINTYLGSSFPVFRDGRFSVRTPLVKRPSESVV